MAPGVFVLAGLWCLAAAFISWLARRGSIVAGAELRHRVRRIHPSLVMSESANLAFSKLATCALAPTGVVLIVIGITKGLGL